MDTAHTVGTVARMAGLTVRTLHHYDRLGLVVPSGRSRAGYRTYDHHDLARLQRVLTYRALGFSLARIRTLLERSDDLEVLRDQRQRLAAQRERLARIAESLDRLLEARIMGINLDPSEILEVFGDDDPSRFAQEAEQAWGGSQQWAESQQRTRRYGKQEWLRLKAEAAEIEQSLAQALRDGLAADHPSVLALAERHRRHIDHWFYPLSHDAHVALGELYVSDARFTAHYDRVAEGLAAFLRGAIRANAAAAGQLP